MYKDQSYDTSVDISALPVTPTKPTNDSGDSECHDEHEQNVVLVLPLDHRVPRQVTDVGNARLATGLDDHPANM